MAVSQISKPPPPLITEERVSVIEGERSPVRVLLVQHQTACLCLSAGASSQPTTESSDRTASCGLASATDFTGRGSRSILRRDLTRLGGRQLQRPSSDSYRDI